ncbi:MAG TPA: methyl-accepting chemotaxis protein [Bdellovibrionota bacterium]|jgi:methyl-accepting chemotaxis protein|nr:methyl-accepting chemotaxis protein [Bdellovibrionota bacterium]
MKNWSIKTKLLGLTSFLLALVLAIGGLSYFGARSVEKSLVDVSNVQLPAVRYMTLADMMHDGLRAVVYRTIYAASIKDETSLTECRTELGEFSENIKNYIGEIRKLDVHPDTKSAIEASLPELDAYVESSKKIIGLVADGQTQNLPTLISNYQESFEKLEAKLEVLGTRIETDADESRTEGQANASKFLLLSRILVIAGFMLGSLVSFFVLKDVDIVRTLSNVIDDLCASVKKLSNASHKSAENSQSLSASATEQAASLQQASSSATEISAMVSRNAEAVTRVLSEVERNAQDAQSGSRSSQAMVNAMNEINTVNQEILSQMALGNQELQRVVSIINDIGQKTKVIDEIVFQTKLLSFNASVEAARAGEHGQGFAVVAQEVGSLAQMSGSSAQEINALLQSSKTTVDEIVEKTTQRIAQITKVGKEKINAGLSTAAECQSNLVRIAEGAKLVATTMSEISTATHEQAQGIDLVNRSIVELEQVNRSNTGLAQESATDAVELSEESKKLHDTVERLRSYIGKTSDESEDTVALRDPTLKAA